MDTIFVSGIPKGLDCAAASLLIRKHIGTVAQVERVFIQKDKGIGFVTLYDATSVDTVLSLDNKISVNGSNLKLCRHRRGADRHKMQKNPGTFPVKKPDPPDSYSFLGGYNTYSAYRRDVPQTDVLYKYAKPVPPRRLQKRKKSRKGSRWSSSVPAPKTDAPVGRVCKTKYRRKQSNKIVNYSEIISQSSQYVLDKSQPTAKRRLKLSKTRRHKQEKDAVSFESLILPANTPEIKRSDVRPGLVRVHVYRTPKYLFSINVDNHNAFESICAEISSSDKVPLESLLLTYHGRSITRTWPLVLEENSNIHTIVKGNGGMMKAGHLDKSSESEDNRDETLDQRHRDSNEFSNWNLGHSTVHKEEEETMQHPNDETTAIETPDVTATANVTSEMAQDTQVSQSTNLKEKTETPDSTTSTQDVTSSSVQDKKVSKSTKSPKKSDSMQHKSQKAFLWMSLKVSQINKPMQRFASFVGLKLKGKNETAETPDDNEPAPDETSAMVQDTPSFQSTYYQKMKAAETPDDNEPAPDVTSAMVQETSTSQSTYHQEIQGHQLRLINNYGLQSCLSEPLMFHDIMYIKENDGSTAKTSKDVPRLLLRNIMMLDYAARENVLSMCSNHMAKQLLKSLKQNESDSDSSDCSFPTEIHTSIPITSQKQDNPIDVFLAIFVCLHPSLQQKLVAKMFTCRLAIPLIYHKFKLNGALWFSLWPFRTITVHDGTSLTSIVNCKQKIVAFVRLDRPPISKSKIANAILRKTGGHQTFYNSECSMGSSEKHATRGLIEASWFLPSTKIPSKLKEVTLFLNLRGDGFTNKEQLSYLKSISHVLIVVIDNTKLDDERVLQLLEGSSSNLIFMVTENITEEFKKQLCKYFEKKLRKKIISIFQVTTDGNPLSITDVREYVLDEIVLLLKDTESRTLAQISETAGKKHICVDEKEKTCTTGMENAKCLTDIFNDSPSIKNTIIPLQSDLWLTYSKNFKTYKKANHLSLQEKDEMQKELVELKHRQYDTYKQGNKFMELFIKHMIESKIEELIFFIDWLKFYFDEKTCEKIHPNNAIGLPTGSDVIVRTSSNAMFGVEHIFRELGQIYLSNQDLVFRSEIAKAMVKAILLGYPFELMDGDAANVPIPWIKHIFNELKESIGDTKVLTVSVIGLQSSGKSTLLNAMFGISLAVSAGRCTRGIYMQLLPVKSHNLPFDYVLVVDTEGLRSIQGSDNDYQHDNELATFVIGIADIAIINIKGENTSEVRDILQICVHAFLRLQIANEKLKLRQSCICIHQNVPAVDAQESLRSEREKFNNILDKMTHEAAKEENDNHVKCFNDVIEFDSENDIWYFSDIWEGEPPMAPANPGYHSDVEKVRSAMFDKLAKEKDKSKYTYRSLTETFEHLDALWTGILANDFVFFFKNSLEIKAYNALYKKIQRHEWDLECFASTLIADSFNDIQKCTSINDIQNVLDEKERLFDERKSICTAEIQKYFKENEHAEIIAKWKDGKLCSWQQEVALVRTKLTDELKDNRDHCRVDRENDQLFEKRRTEITEKANRLARQMKEKMPTKTEIESKFGCMWSTWFDNLNEKRERPPDIEKSLIHILKQFCFPNKLDLVTKELSFLCIGCLPEHKLAMVELPTSGYLQYPWKIDNSFFGNIQKCISVKRMFTLTNKTHYLPNVIDITNSILREIKVLLNDLSETKWKYNDTKAKDIGNRIEERVERINSDPSTKFSLLAPYTIKLTVHIFRHAIPIFQKLDSDYRAHHGIQAKMKRVKSQILGHFRDIVTKASVEEIARNRFCEVILEHVEQHVRREIPRIIYEDIVEYFDVCKQELMKHIMKRLAQEEIFQSIIHYIEDPYTSSFEFLKISMNERWFGSNTNSKYIDKVSEIVNKLINQVTTIASECQASSLELWLKQVIYTLQDTLPVKLENMSLVQEQAIVDIDSFKQTLGEQLIRTCERIKEIFRLDENTVRWDGETPYDKAMKKIWGCKGTCPFCNEPCKIDRIHDGSPHECIQHRALGVNGWRSKESRCLVIESCSFNVQTKTRFTCGSGRLCKRESDKCTIDGTTDESHPYRDYEKYAPDWKIDPCVDISSSMYWAWVLCKYNKDIAEHYRVKEADIPNSWTILTNNDAIESLFERQSLLEILESKKKL
ncbi:interferon-induced very large GTPase 1-like [Mizuhopecten yessoensis]|nr:interferon-induced very large GTPase 1-like [Mizuhopecten yessoensis]